MTIDPETIEHEASLRAELDAFERLKAHSNVRAIERKPNDRHWPVVVRFVKPYRSGVHGLNTRDFAQALEFVERHVPVASPAETELSIRIEARIAEFERRLEEEFKPALFSKIGDVLTELGGEFLEASLEISAKEVARP